MKLDHFNIRTDNLDGVRDILVRLLQLEEGTRPPFPFPGYWLYGEGRPIIHLTERETDPGNTTGALDHVALKDEDYDGLITRLENDDVKYSARVVPGSGMRQVFFKINHDVMIEVDFEPVN